jgi:hypothetical protein
MNFLTTMRATRTYRKACPISSMYDKFNTKKEEVKRAGRTK